MVSSYAVHTSEIQHTARINSWAFNFSATLHLVDYLFIGAVVCAVLGFAVAVASAEIYLPVVFQIAFDVGVLAMLILLGIGIVGAVGEVIVRLCNRLKLIAF